MKLQIYSKAAHSTWIYLSQYNLLFDCGEGCSTILGINTIASIRTIVISHEHADHTAGLYNLIRLRSRHGDNIPKLTIYFPSTDKMFKLINFIGPHKNVEWIQFVSTDILQTSNKTLEIEPFLTDHCWHSYGFNLIERRTRLKEEYAKLTTLTSYEISNLVGKGIEVKESFTKTLLTYTGDTPPIEDTSIFNNPDILICDTTYLDKNDNNENYRHCTLEDSLKMFDNSGAKKMIGMHLSARYDLGYIQNTLLHNVERKTQADLLNWKIQLADPDKVNNYVF